MNLQRHNFIRALCYSKQFLSSAQCRKSRRQNALAILLLSLVAFAAIVGCKKQPAPVAPPVTLVEPTDTRLPTEEITVGGKVFTVELAFKSMTRQRGLMFREHLPDDAGMLFIFDRSKVQSFYMKNCLIDLDIVYIEANGRIAKIATMPAPTPGARLEYYSSDIPVKFALELPAGAAQMLGLQPGQTITFPARIDRVIPDPD